MTKQNKLDQLLVRESENGNTEIVKVLLEAGADVHAMDDAALRVAKEKGHTETVKALIEAQADVSARAGQKKLNDELLSASSDGDEDAVTQLLKNGADVHASQDWALRAASAGGHSEIVKALLKAGADVHALEDSALSSASAGGHTETVRLLLKAGAGVLDAGRNYARSMAQLNGHKAVVRLLDAPVAASPARPAAGAKPQVPGL